jgi:hypothetical protein
MRIGALAATLIFLSESLGFADHELRKSVFESLGPNAWGMYILLPIPFLALGVIGYFYLSRLEGVRFRGLAPVAQLICRLPRSFAD